MAGTQTTVLVEGDPKRKEAVASSTIDTSDVLTYVSGSIGTVQPGPAGGTLGNLKVAKEALDVEYGGSYAASELTSHYILEPGDRAMVKAFATSAANGSIAAGTFLGLSADQDGRLAPAAHASENKAVAIGTLDPAAGTAKAVIEVEAI